LKSLSKDEYQEIVHPTRLLYASIFWSGARDTRASVVFRACSGLPCLQMGVQLDTPLRLGLSLTEVMTSIHHLPAR